MRILVTGGSGFIGSALIRLILAETDWQVINLDKLTYAADPTAHDALRGDPRYAFIQGDIADGALLARLFAEYRPAAVLHLAAETHVDRSIAGPAAFLQTNVMGTAVLLDAALAYWRGLPDAGRDAFRFLQVSTDEVFGALELDENRSFTEDSPYRPNSPYAASKAAADHLVRAWHRTYGLPVLISHSANNYGPGQHPEKLIPRMISAALDSAALPVYGDGRHVRDWLHVDDHARALIAILTHGGIGESYAVGGGTELANLDLVGRICGLLDAAVPAGAPHARLIAHVADRPGHDRRYATDSAKLRRALGWVPREDFAEGLARTVDWYVAHRRRTGTPS